MTASRAIWTCLVIRDGVDFLAEVYDAVNGEVEDFTVFPPNLDGTKGESIVEDGFELEVQAKYQQWFDANRGDITK